MQEVDILFSLKSCSCCDFYVWCFTGVYNYNTLHVHLDQNLVTVVLLFSRSSWTGGGGPYCTIGAARTSVLVII